MKPSIRFLTHPLAFVLALGTVWGAQHSTAYGHNLTVAVVVVDFRDVSGPGLGAETLANLYTKPNAVDRYFRAQSFGELGLTGLHASEGDLYGPITIGYDSTPCNLDAWRAAVDSELDVCDGESGASDCARHR